MSENENRGIDGVTREMVAMYVSPGNLAGKLQAIWQYSEDVILRVEERRRTELRKAWGDLATHAMKAETALSFKSALVRGHKLQHQDRGGLLLPAYFGALAVIGEVKDAYADIMIRQDHTTILYDQLCVPENLDNKYYRDEVVPLFFALQLHCAVLARYANAKEHTNPDELRREQTARKGGIAKREADYGEEVLKADVVRCLKALKDGAYKSLPALLAGPLMQVWDEYSAGIGSPRERGGPTILYGQDFDKESFIRKVEGWADKDPQVRGEVERVCRSYWKSRDASA